MGKENRQRQKFRKKLPTGRYGAKLLFQYRVVVEGKAGGRCLCEERIINFRATHAEAALREAKRRGRAVQHTYKNIHGNSVCFQFLGVMGLIRLDGPCDTDEVWYELTERVRPMERRAALIPPENRLHAIRNHE